MPTLFPRSRALISRSLPQKLTLDPAAAGNDHCGFQRRGTISTFDHTILTIAAPKGLSRRRRIGREESDGAYYAYPVGRASPSPISHPREPRGADADEGAASRPPTCSAAGEIMAGNVLGKGYAAGIGDDHRQRVRPCRRTEAARKCEELRRRALASLSRLRGEVGLLPAMRSIVRCNPGEGEGLRESNSRREPLTPALSPRGRGEGERKEREEPCRAFAIASVAVLLIAGSATLPNRSHCVNGLVPCRRAAGRNLRQAGEGGRVHAGGVPPRSTQRTYQVEQMYVQYFLRPMRRAAYPLLMWQAAG